MGSAIPRQGCLNGRCSPQLPIEANSWWLAQESPNRDVRVRCPGVRGPALEQVAKLFFGEARVTNNTA